MLELLAVSASSAPNGSSIKRILASFASTRAIATRCFIRPTVARITSQSVPVPHLHKFSGDPLDLAVGNLRAAVQS